MNIHNLILNKHNPREISDIDFQRLVDSLLNFPKMLSLRPIVVDEKKVVIGGNQRTEALRFIFSMDLPEIEERLSNNKKYMELSEDERDELLTYWKMFKDNPVVPVKVADEFTDNEAKEFIIKDNMHYGEDDVSILKEDYEIEELECYMGNVDQLMWDFEDINDEQIEEDEIKLMRLKCGYIISILSDSEYQWLIGEYSLRSDSLEKFVEEVLL